MNTDIDTTNKSQLKNKIEEEILSRRLVLRGIFAVGCGLVFPVALIGCDSKEGEKPSSAAPTDSSPGSTGTESAAPATEVVKAPQQAVQYQTEPRNGQKCGECQYFIADSNSCKLVEGQISPDGWCTLWTKKS